MGSKSAIGIGNGICFKQVRDKGGGSYIDPLVRDSIVGLWKFDQNTNESPTRNIIKNTIKNKGGDLELLNFGYKLNSGYNGYATDFTEWYGTYSNKTQTKITVSIDIYFPISIISFKNVTSAPSFRIKVSGLLKGQNLYYKYINEEGLLEEKFNIPSDGIYTLPATAVSDTPTTVAMLANEQYNINIKGLTIEQLPLYEGALVTDGKDDMIVSQKTVQEMGITDKITVVSMIHQIGIRSEYNRAFNNYICNQNVGFIRNNIAGVGIGKTGIYGYTWNNSTKSVINNILGDKNDYSIEVGNSVSIEGKFTVEGYINNDSPDEISEVAVYWTFIANKVLTTDEINQIIAYFKLDKYVTPQVIYDVKRQGLTNDTPAADWYLKDFSGNGHDMTLYNFAKKLGSGISKYEEDFTSWFIGTNINVTNDTIKAAGIVSSYVLTKVTPNSEIAPFTIKVTGIPKNGEIRYYYCSSSTKIDSFYIREDGQYNVPQSERWELTGSYRVGFTISNPSLDWSRLVIEQIPDYEGALVSDGIDDYGKVENLPIYKDYTVVADREIVDGLIDNVDGGVATRSSHYGNGAFGFDWKNQAFSFGGNTDRIIDVQRFISYQSKYVNNGIQLITGNVVDNNPLYMARLGEENRYSKLALWSFLLFPYTLSEFLLERQLKRYKLGTLYPGMIEWRPKVNINVPVVTPPTFSMNNGSDIITNGQYIPEGTEITIRIFTTTDSSVGGINEATAKINGVDIELSPSGNKTYYGGKFIVSSKQKIDITIDEYIRYEDIVQPYPAIINLKQDGKTITWGDKLKVGSDIVFVESANLLPELYTVSETRYNGVTLYPNTIIKVEKSMVFDNARTYLKANEPSCILSPNRLRIPNSSYKILGYIPDLTGKGNHGIINNSAYAEMSGANGYKYDWNTYTSHIAGVKPTDNAFKVNLTAETSTTALFGTPIFTVGSKSHYFRFKISGLINNQKIQIDYPKGSDDTVITSDRFGNGEYSTKDYTVGEVKRLNFYVINAVKGEPISVSIEQLPEYESSFCLDGVDDFVTIPTLAHGGKQVLMKVNYKLNNGTTCTIYDQRNSTQWLPTFCIYSNNEAIAYSDGNSGKTYIDGVLNTSVKGRQLANITHNITIANEDVTDVNSVSPKIGTLFVNGSAYAQMALFDFMLFPEISSEDEIKELNDIIGIEGGYVESPNYYWDAYGKKNTDTDRNLIADQVS